ncbi:MAG: rRNA maturation RNase YbeY [Planctomycetota bacterium]|nr:rRNA maturation RNase YbeY [Planctomycetota bacterium]
MTIQVIWESAQQLLGDDAVAQAANAALDHGGRSGASLSVVMVDDEEMIRIHEDYLDDPTPTDVITFDLAEELEDTPASELPAELATVLAEAPVGELFVGVEMAERVARERGVSSARELALYVVHGVLHLCGFDDVDAVDRAAMRVAENVVMGRLGYEPDTAPHERG